MTPKYGLNDWPAHAQVKKQVQSWHTHRHTQNQSHAQLHWSAHVVEHVNFLNELTAVHGNSAKGTITSPLPKKILVFGPHFVPLSYLHCNRPRELTYQYALVSC